MMLGTRGTHKLRTGENTKRDLPGKVQVRNIVTVANVLCHSDYDSIVIVVDFSKWFEKKIDHALFVVKCST